ncbi:MAG: DUF1697 domain-containing protein [Candidatus Sulfotelmatobacter sp.]|jgi:uncharacterized protein (DUF1697 family)
MPVYVALLRGINLGGHKKIKMEELRASLAAMGFDDVKTYIQSGNVVFKTAKISDKALSRKIEATILSKFGHSVSVIIRTADEIKQVIANNPFLKQADIDQTKLHVMFLTEPPAQSALKQLETLVLKPDQFRSLGKELYFYLPNGVAESAVMKKPIDRGLAIPTTMRNWRTVNTIQQMCVDFR